MNIGGKLIDFWVYQMNWPVIWTPNGPFVSDGHNYLRHQSRGDGRRRLSSLPAERKLTNWSIPGSFETLKEFWMDCRFHACLDTMFRRPRPIRKQVGAAGIDGRWFRCRDSSMRIPFRL
jgi:hypothetical protein